MQIQGNKPAPEGDNRRFAVGKAPAKEGAKSFSAALKQAKAAAAPSPAETAPSVHPAPAPAPLGAAPLDASAPAGTVPPGASGPSPAAAPDSSPAQAGADLGPTRRAGKAGTDASFADHMETVRFRLRTGYYSSKAIEDALSEKLSGYFDELA